MEYRCSRLSSVIAVVIGLAILICATSASPQRHFSRGHTLYGPGDKVFLLDSTNIKQNVFNSDRAWFVEFYANWCPHCQRFAPFFKKFAEDVWDWRDIVVVAALDCADEMNTATCREFEVYGYPTLRFFPPNSPPHNDLHGRHYASTNKGIPMEKSEIMSELKQDLIDQLELYYPKLLRFSNMTLTPNVDPVVELFRSTSELQFPVRPTAIIVIFESPTSYVGKEVALKLSSHKFIKVYRFQRSNVLYNMLELNTWPAAGFISSSGGMQRIDIGSRDWVGSITDTALMLAGAGRRPEPRTTPKPYEVPTRSPSIQTRAGAEKRSDIVSMDDLLHALRDTLHREIPIVNVIEGEKLEALRKFLHAVHRFFPADRKEIRAFFRLLHRWVMTRDKIPATDFVETLRRLEERFRPWDGVNLGEWDDCKGTVPGRRGYTCGLWRLFHTLTIVAVQHNANEGALDAIHSYVKEFFACTDCRQHFTAMVARDGILAHRNAVAQALWLWRAHNEVNLRTKGTTSEDPGYPKQSYPSKTLCPECYDINSNFIEARVLDYLLRIYTRPRRSQQVRHTHRASPRRHRYPVMRRRQGFVGHGYVQPRQYWLQ